MYRKYALCRPSVRHHRLLQFLFVVGSLCLCISGISTGDHLDRAYADSVPGGNISDPVARAVTIAAPAVVRIYTTLGGHLTVRFPGGQSVTFPQNGGHYTLSFSGSGAFITANGDILTATHVTHPPQDQTLKQYLEQEAASDIAKYVNQTYNPNPLYSSQDVLAVLEDGYFSDNATYDASSSEVYLSTGYTGPLSVSNMKDVSSSIHMPVDRIEQENTDADVAIVHVNMSDTPSIGLDNSDDVQVQDNLTVIGFPGNGDINQNDPTNLLTPSVNKVYVSALKTAGTGKPVIQVGGNVEHGDSGGPTLDSMGNIVGVVSEYLYNADTPIGTSFLQASSSAIAMVQSLSLDTTPGPFQRAWYQAFTDYASNTPGHWHKAVQEFTSLSTTYSLFQAVTPYLTYAQQQAQYERLPRPSTPRTAPNNTWIWITLVVLAFLFLLILLPVFLIRRALSRWQNNSGPLSEEAFSSDSPSTTSTQEANQNATDRPQEVHASSVALLEQQPPPQEDSPYGY